LPHASIPASPFAALGPRHQAGINAFQERICLLEAERAALDNRLARANGSITFLQVRWRCTDGAGWLDCERGHRGSCRHPTDVLK
jgi:hypothetical protein